MHPTDLSNRGVEPVKPLGVYRRDRRALAVQIAEEENVLVKEEVLGLELKFLKFPSNNTRGIDTSRRFIHVGGGMQVYKCARKWTNSEHAGNRVVHYAKGTFKYAARSACNVQVPGKPGPKLPSNPLPPFVSQQQRQKQIAFTEMHPFLRRERHNDVYQDRQYEVEAVDDLANLAFVKEEEFNKCYMAWHYDAFLGDEENRRLAMEFKQKCSTQPEPWKLVSQSALSEDFESALGDEENVFVPRHVHTITPQQPPREEVGFFEGLRRLPGAAYGAISAMETTTQQYGEVAQHANAVVQRFEQRYDQVFTQISSVLGKFSSGSQALDVSLLAGDVFNLFYDAAHYEKYALPVLLMKTARSLAGIFRGVFPVMAKKVFQPQVVSQSLAGTDLFKLLFDNPHIISVGRTMNAFRQIHQGFGSVKELAAWIFGQLPEGVQELFSYFRPEAEVWKRELTEFGKRLFDAQNAMNAQAEVTLQEAEYLRVTCLKYSRVLFMAGNAHAQMARAISTNRKLTLMIVMYANNWKKRNEPRKCPFSVVFHGGTRVGKTVFIRKFIENFATLEGHRGRQSYTRVSGTDNWDGFTDDVFATIWDDWLQHTDYEDVAEFFALVTKQHYMVPMASLDDPSVGVKGTLNLCKLVVAATNLENKTAVSTKINAPDALFARIGLRVKVTKVGDYDETDYKHLRFRVYAQMSDDFVTPELGYDAFLDHATAAYTRHYLTQERIDAVPVDQARVARMRNIVQETRMEMIPPQQHQANQRALQQGVDMGGFDPTYVRAELIERYQLGGPQLRAQILAGLERAGIPRLRVQAQGAGAVDPPLASPTGVVSVQTLPDPVFQPPGLTTRRMALEGQAIAETARMAHAATQRALQPTEVDQIPPAVTPQTPPPELVSNGDAQLVEVARRLRQHVVLNPQVYRNMRDRDPVLGEVEIDSSDAEGGVQYTAAAMLWHFTKCFLLGAAVGLFAARTVSLTLSLASWAFNMLRPAKEIPASIQREMDVLQDYFEIGTTSISGLIDPPTKQQAQAAIGRLTSISKHDPHRLEIEEFLLSLRANVKTESRTLEQRGVKRPTVATESRTLEQRGVRRPVVKTESELREHPKIATSNFHGVQTHLNSLFPSYVPPRDENDTFVSEGLGDANMQEVANKLRKCIVPVALVVRDFKKSYVGDVRVINYVNAIPLQPYVYLFPKHFFLGADGRTYTSTKDLEYQLIFRVNGLNHPIAWNSARFRPVLTASGAETVDAAIYNVAGSTMPASASCMTYFVRESELAVIKFRESAKMIGYSLVSGQPVPFDREFTTNVIQESMSYEHGDQRYYVARGFSYATSTQGGDCGSPLLIANPALPHKVVGIHIFGASNKAFGGSTVITYEMLDRMFERKTEFLDTDVKFTMTERAAALQAQCLGLTINVLGELDEHVNVNRKTDFLPTPLLPELAERTNLPSEKRQHEGFDPLHVTGALFGGDLYTPGDLYEQQKDAYFARCFGEDDGGVLDVKQAVNAYGGMESLNLHTSAGYPHVLRGLNKRDFLTKDVHGHVTYNDPAYECFLQDYTDSWRKTERAVIWMHSLKDELVKPGKLCRGFDFAPLEYTIACRAYFGSWISMMHRDAGKHFSCIGINPESFQWTKLVQRLLRVSDKGADADAPNYDKNTLPHTLHRACRQVNLWYKKNDPRWIPEDDDARFNLVAQMYKGYVLLGGVLIERSKGMPSGHILTALFNTMTNMDMHLTWFLENVPASLKDTAFYDLCVVTLLYGDDSWDSIRQDLLGFLNRHTMIKTYARWFTMTITSADKSGTIVPYDNVLDLSFLKRSTRRDGLLFKPMLAERSILSMLAWTRENKYATREEQLFENARVASSFAYFYGYDYYTRFTTWFTARFPTCTLPQYSYYDQLFLGGHEWSLY